MRRHTAAQELRFRPARDRAAIENLIVTYAHVYDALDADGYASIFAEDADFTFGGNTLHGRAAIRGVITGALERRSKFPSGSPGGCVRAAAGRAAESAKRVRTPAQA